MSEIDVSRWQCGPNLIGEDAEDTLLLNEMRNSAINYVKSFRWSPPIKRICLAFGVGGVIALFLVDFDHAIESKDTQLWVVVGDLPAAYFVIDEARDEASALTIYCDLMAEWAQAVQRNGSLDDVFPVDAAPSKANAEQLLNRLAFIRGKIIPTL